MTEENKKIERTPAEVAAIQKEVDKKRASGNKVIDIKLDEKEKQPKAEIDRIALLEAYKVQNPVKFAAKGLDKELKKLK